jgi:phosphoadenosine phosphosulfate reductase
MRAARILDWACAAYRDRIVLACSFGGPAGMVLVDLVARRASEFRVPVYFIDTGLLFPETYVLVERVRERYGIDPLPVRSEVTLEAQAARDGDALWDRDPDRCCAIRKVEPQRAFLAGYGAWITGLRRDQTAERSGARAVEWDERSGGLAKISPLVDWTDADVWRYVVEHDVPYNSLNDNGYPSIGCTPCTRAVRAGEDARAGRWSSFGKTECGLHAKTTAA